MAVGSRRCERLEKVGGEMLETVVVGCWKRLGVEGRPWEAAEGLAVDDWRREAREGKR